MKSPILIKISCITLLSLSLFSADAQRNGRRRPDTQTGTNTQQTGSQQTQQTNVAKPPSGYNPYGNVPIVVDSSGSTSGVMTPSMRNDGATVKVGDDTLLPLPYEDLRWDDALFKEKVWRELDLREKINQSFRRESQGDDGKSEMFVDMLLEAVQSGKVTAWADDAFRTPKALTDIMNATAGSADTTPVYDPNDINKILRYQVTRENFNAKTVNKIAIKEEWVFDREASRMFVRIIGIAPLQSKYLPNGQERGVSPLFWIYYPDLRTTLASHRVYNSKNMGAAQMTWEELFETRMFSSYIVKTTMDNPGNKIIRQMIKDPILALLEGENLKERIFNYEQDLWSY